MLKKRQLQRFRIKSVLDLNVFGKNSRDNENIKSPYDRRDFVQFGKTKSRLDKGAKKCPLI